MKEKDEKGSFSREGKNSQADCKFIVISSPLFPFTNIIVYVFTELPTYYGKHRRGCGWIGASHK